MSTLLTGEVLRASDAVLERIVAGTYPAGLRLPAESDLAAELGLSRSTLREALRHLAGLGVVQSRRGSGVLVLDFRREGTLALLPAYVAAGSFDQPLKAMVSELLRMRTVLALEATRLAATYATPATLAPARDLLATLTHIEDDATRHALLELDMFRALVHSSAMWPAVWLGNAFWSPMREMHERFAPAAGFIPRDYARTFHEIFRRIEAKDAEGAVSLLRTHFERVDQVIEEKLDDLLEGSRVAQPRQSAMAVSAKGMRP